MKNSFRSVSLIGIIVLLASAFGGIMPAKAETIVLINEVDADQVSTDSAEFVELYDGGVGNTSLTGLSLVLYNGSDNLSYLAFDLDGQSTDGDGYFVLCGNAANVPNCDLDVSPDTNLIQNGEDAVALLVGDAVNYPNDTALPADGDIVDAIVYETGSDTDSGLLVLLNAGQGVVDEGGGGDQTGHSNQRCANGSGGARNTDTYAQFDPTPGAENDCSGVVVDTAPSVAATTPVNAATSVAIDANIEITFSEAVEASGVWFDITCTSSGAHSAAVSGGSTTFTLDPDINFGNSENCTVTVLAAQVTDQDAEDPPDNMEADFIFSFDIVGIPSVSEDVIINELDADQVDTDAAEFIELYDYGVGNTDLTGLVLVLFNGSDDASYLAFDLDGYSTDADGYFVLCGNAANVANCDLDVSPDTNLIQNGADAAALLVGDAADFPNDTPVTTDGLLDAIVYDTSDSDDPGLLVLLNAGQPQVNERGGDDGTAHSNQRCPDGSGGARNTDTYAQFDPTPGSENVCGVEPPPDVIINELDADQVSTDAAEFIELYDGGVGNTDLSGLVLVLFNGSDDASYQAFDLDGYSTDADGYFVLCGDAANVANCDLDVSPNTNLIQNGADAAALLVGDAADFPEDTPVTTDGLLDAIVYDTSDSDDPGLLVLLNAGQPQVNERDGGDGTAHSNQRCPDGSGGARNTDSYAQHDPTPGAENTCPPPSECGLAYTPIYTIQGSDFASPLVGTLVDVEGIVTGDLQDGKYGFTIQDALGDGDPATSDGVFIYASSPDINVGDHVRVTGYVAEYYDLTEITSVSYFELCSTGNSVAATPISLPVAYVSDLEAYEGMLVTFAQPLYISEYYNFARYGEIVLSTERQFQPTATYDPGSDDAAQMLIDNFLSRIKLDDGRGSQNPDPALHPNGGIFDLSNLFRGGGVLNNLTGVVDYNYGEYKIQPTTGADYVNANPRTAQPDDVGGNLIVASFNVLNYFTTIDTGAEICGPTQDMECRGADTVEEFNRQRAKIIAALAAMDADVVGLIEIENNEFEAVADLVAGLNDAVGTGTYAYVDTGYIGTDAIKVAFIYKTGTVSLVSDHAILDESVDSRFIDTKNRPALAQSFMDNNTGGIFTAVVNHLKSKGSPCDDIGDPDLGDGAGNCNLTRTAAAEALVDWLASDPTNSGDADFLIIGDLNAYDKENPIDAILAGGYSDLVYQFVGENAYSYVFDGQLGYLDHALANDELASQITGATVWHINADEASLIDYDMSYKKDAQDLLYESNAYRSSDHDPVVIGLNVCDEIAPTLEITLSHDTLWPANHKYVDVTATVITSDNFDLNPTVTLLSVTSSEADDENGDGDGSTVDDIVIIDDYIFQLRAERSAKNKDGRVYTITYQVTDACGNSTTASAEVTVPHNQGKKKDSSGETDSLDLPSETEAITPEPTPEPTEEPDVALTPEPTETQDDKEKKDK